MQNDDQTRRGFARGLTDYGDRAFSLYLRRSFASAMGYSREMLDRPDEVDRQAETSRRAEARRAERSIDAGFGGVLRAVMGWPWSNQPSAVAPVAIRCETKCAIVSRTVAVHAGSVRGGIGLASSPRKRPVASSASRVPGSGGATEARAGRHAAWLSHSS